MHESPEERRRSAAAKAWNIPAVGDELSAPALAISPPPFAVEFEVGPESAHWQSRLNFGTMALRTNYTTWFPVTLTLAVVALDDQPTERKFIVTPTYGSIGARIYSPPDQTTTFTWTIPAGRVLMPICTGTSDTVLEFDWTAEAGRRSKIMLTATTASEVVGRGALISGWMPLPIDSSVVGDVNSATDGTY